jgi:hypothetical protein
MIIRRIFVAMAMGAEDRNKIPFLRYDTFAVYANRRPSVKSDISERKPLHGASTVMCEFGMRIMLPSLIHGKPILFRVNVAAWAAKSLSFTVRLPINTRGSGIIASRKNIGNIKFFTISLPKKNNTRPYSIKIKENADRKPILSEVDIRCTKMHMITIQSPVMSLDILVFIITSRRCHNMNNDTIGMRKPCP